MAAFVPKFENDLFISYAHEDDRRWVQAFEDELRDEVSRRLGLAISIWQDTARIRAGQNWQSAIREGIKQSAAFLAIISPRLSPNRPKKAIHFPSGDHAGWRASLKMSGGSRNASRR